MTNQRQALSNAGESKSHMPLVVLGGAAVALATFLFVMNPRFVEMHAKAQAQLADEIARENRAFCVKRGFAVGIREHASCVEDLNELRAKYEKRIYESVFGLI